MSTELLQLQVPTRAAGDNSQSIASTAYVDSAISAQAGVAATEYSGTKTQTVVAATNVATITPIDGAGGTVTFSIVSDDGTEANVQTSRRHYSIVKNASATTVAISAAGTQADSSKASASGTFSPTVATATASGSVVTFTITTRRSRSPSATTPAR